MPILQIGKWRQEALTMQESPSPLSVPSGRWPAGSWVWCLGSATSPLSVDMGHVGRRQRKKITGAKRHIFRKQHFWLKIFKKEFPGGLAVRILGFYCHGLVQSLVREMRSCKSCNTVLPAAPPLLTKKKKKKKKKNPPISKNSFSPNIPHDFCEGNILHMGERETMS